MDGDLQQSCPAVTNANDEHCNLSELAHSTTPLTTAYTPRDYAKEYLLINEAGAGSCGKVTFCVRKPSATDKSNDPKEHTAIVAVKTTHSEPSRAGITQEILALQHIQTLLTEHQHAHMRNHLPMLIDFDPPTPPPSQVVAAPGSRWLATPAIQGFNLIQLTNTLNFKARLLSPIVHGPNAISPDPTLPATLMLHIA
jgi:hypothetical protein